MKKPQFISKLRFFFRWKLTWNDFDSDNQNKLMVMCYWAKKDENKVVFKRTFNNHAFGQNGFEFIGFYPVFHCKELSYSYFSESNEID